MKTITGHHLLLEFAFGEGDAQVCVKSTVPNLGSLLIEEVKNILRP